MRLLTFILLLILFCCKVFGQDSLWKTKSIDQFLTLKLPVKFQYNKSSFIKAYVGEINGNYYALQCYDTIFLPINNEEDFQISLTGFISARSGDPTLKKYDALVVDTTIGGVKGLFATFTTTAPSETYKTLYYFVTLANNKYYWFYVYSSEAGNTNSEANFFFKSVQFDFPKLKERSFKLTSTHLTKKAE